MLDNIELRLDSESIVRSMRPLLKWAGGKSQLLDELTKALPDKIGRYFEPFLGGGALFFHLALPGSRVSDSNGELIHFYQIVRDEPRELASLIKSFPITREFFDYIRKLQPHETDEVLRAARFLYLNKTCFNGLHRVNRKGEFNTPFGGKNVRKVVDAVDLVRASVILRECTLVCEDYESALLMTSDGDFVYLDPPYLPVGKYGDFKRYTKEQFGDADHRKLAQLFGGLRERGVNAILSNSCHPDVPNLYRGNWFKLVSARRAINCRPEGRGVVQEYLVTNYEVSGFEYFS